MRKNLLIADDDRKFYYFARDGSGKVFNAVTRKEETFTIKNWEQYAQQPAFLGGGLYSFPVLEVVIVFEQSGKKPNKKDPFYHVFGDIKFDKPTVP